MSNLGNPSHHSATFVVMRGKDPLFFLSYYARSFVDPSISLQIPYAVYTKAINLLFGFFCCSKPSQPAIWLLLTSLL
jgi:hypothetical protein